MSGGELIGDIAQGALIARAVEPSHGEQAADGHTHERVCLNCGTPLVGSHCHNCGQVAHVHKTIAAFFHDLLHGVFHFEGKIWRTLPMLAWQPGRLTREYIDGRRASYVSPIALFLFVVFLTFAVFNLTSNPLNLSNSDVSIKAGAAQAETDTLANIAELEGELAAAKAAGDQTGGLEGQLAGARGALEGIRATKNGKLPEKIAKADSSADQDLADRANAVWKKATENPELAIFKLQSSAYKYSWLLIPISVPFVWLLFPFRRRFHLYDHTVFVTYSLSFMLLLLSAASLAAMWNIVLLTKLLVLYVPLHMYRQLRGTYDTSRRGALWRTLVLSVFATIALVLFSLSILALTIS
jgi:hypothetical protein